MAEHDSLVILALVRDLMFASRIGAEAKAAGVGCQIVRDASQLPAGGRMLLVDLNLDGAIEAAAAWQRAGGGSVLGFVSHVDAQTISDAKAAGIARVLPRSRFVQILPQILREV